MDDQKNLSQKLNLWRQKNLPNFSKIKISPRAMEYTFRLFLHPFCVNTIDFRKLIQNKPIRLESISRYILTAFPNTICYYAQRKNQYLIKARDILECFALDHLDSIQENQIEKKYTPSYALSHALTICQVKKIRQQKNLILVDLEHLLNQKKIIFKNVFVPEKVTPKLNEKVFHHFGVIIDHASKPKLNRFFVKIKANQSQNFYFQKIHQNSLQTINFGKNGLYNFDLTSFIIQKNQNRVSLPFININLTSKIKIPFTK